MTNTQKEELKKNEYFIKNQLGFIIDKKLEIGGKMVYFGHKCETQRNYTITTVYVYNDVYECYECESTHIIEL